MPDRPTDIVQFWQAVEIFSPQSLPKSEPAKGVRDYRRGASQPMPWDPASPLKPPESGKVWRHEVFGGVYMLSKVRDLLVREFGEDNPETRIGGESALFACTIDAHGAPLDGSQVVSACAWACGQLARGGNPLSASPREIREQADDLSGLAGPGSASALRWLATVVRDAIPDAVSGGIGAIVTGLLAFVGGPFAAAGGAAAGSIAARAAKAVTGDGDSLPADTGPRTLAVEGTLTGEDLHQFTCALARRLGVGDALAPAGIRVRSYQIRAADADEEPETSFLNSFIVEDLMAVAAAIGQGEIGAALAAYLTPDWRIRTADRLDVQRSPLVIRDALAPEFTPRGRWVTDTSMPLVFSQQFAVNEAIAELGGGAGLFAVNGPPGTGKTTMLRDLVAAIIVGRAIELAKLPQPADAFPGQPYRWEVESYPRRIWTPLTELTGAEIVVASSNNGAVENVTAEIPGTKGIGAEFAMRGEDLDYFTRTARSVHGDGAWAMIAARLGNRKNRGQFVDRFWFKSMRHVLADPEPPDWQGAVAAFRAALARVDALSAERGEAARSLSLLSSVAAELAAVRSRVAETSGWLGAAATSRKVSRLDREYRQLECHVTEAVRCWDGRVPAGAEFDATNNREQIELRELSAPWADHEFASARAELFLSALALHKALVLGAVDKFRDNLNAMTDILGGKGYPADPYATLAAWQTLFLVVPVVSSTFASFGKLFTGLGRECLGWLLIDEAGQAAPQNAAGALWRSRRAVIVGDPLQLEPVVTIPWEGQQALLREFDVTEQWAPSRTSVQQVADQHSRCGTWLPSTASGERIWVGAPLRVHRRCDHPMFDVSNAVAYEGLMVYGTPEHLPFPGASGWIDTTSAAADDAALRALLGSLGNDAVPVNQIRLLSPFVAVADEARKIHAELFPNVERDDRKNWVGTVHTMQGKEADVVVLVLGGDARTPRARSFATGKPNLLNVAVSRARRRLYVIGNRKVWGDDGYFKVLADYMPVMPVPGRLAPGETLIMRDPSAPAEMVWRTRNGRAYHMTQECDWLRRSSTLRQISLQEATADGLFACSDCSSI